MCTRIDIEEIVDLKFANHELQDIKRHAQLDDKLDRTLIEVRDSIPPSLSPYLLSLERKIDALTERVSPAVSAMDTAQNVQKSVIWLAALILAIGAIYATFKNLFK